MTDIIRQNLKELHQMIRHELATRGYYCDVFGHTGGFRGDYIVCKPFRDPQVKRAYQISIPQIFEGGKYIVGDAKRKIQLLRCANETCHSYSRIIKTYHYRDAERLTEQMAKDIELNFVEPDWMR